MKSRIWMVALLLIVGGISAGILGVFTVYTAPIVARNKEIKFKTTILDAFGVSYTLENLDAVFEKDVNTKQLEEDFVCYELHGKEGEKTTAIAFEVGGPGFWARIDAIIALESDLETIRDLRILAHTETPGLGARIVEPWFQAQFKGKKIKPHLFVVPYRKAVGENEVDAITGATETSKKLEKIINENARIFLEKFRKGNPHL
ncbi:MAG: FMN-binding protein [Candidatus Brocadiales bacterium]